MAEVIPDAQQEFWRSPVSPALATVANYPASQAVVLDPLPSVAQACSGCGTEFLLGSHFCHSCGTNRPGASAEPVSDSGTLLHFASEKMAGALAVASAVPWRRVLFPKWLQYLHFHEIKRWVGLPTASLIAFIIGLGCVTGAIGVSFVYQASNLAEFQAIQMWRIEWLLAATASFVAGILLKRPSEDD